MNYFVSPLFNETLDFINVKKEGEVSKIFMSL